MAQKDFKTFETFELPATRGKRPSCELCGKEFKLFIRQHMCKRCGRSICEDCGTFKTIVYKANFDRKPHRLCKSCHPESEFIKNYIQHYKLSFGEGSEIGEKWIKRIRVPTEAEKKLAKKESRKEVVFTEQMYGQLWNSYNFSFREFVGSLTLDRNSTEVYRFIYGALQQLGSLTQVRLQNAAGLVVFLLCFCTMQDAAKIACQLTLLTKNDPGYRQNLSTCLKQLGSDQIERRKLDEYMDYRYRKFTSMLSLNCITFQGSLYIVDQIISKKSLIELDRYFASVVYQQRQNILKLVKVKIEVDVMVLRCMNSKAIEKMYQSLTKVDLKQSNLSEEVQVSPKKLRHSPSPPSAESKSSPPEPKVTSHIVMKSRPGSISMEEEHRESDTRRTVSTFKEQENLRSRVNELQVIIQNSRAKQSRKQDVSDFKKKNQLFGEDSFELPSSVRADSVIRVKASEDDSDLLTRLKQQQLYREQLELKIKKLNSENSKQMLLMEGKVSLLQRQLELATKQKNQLAGELEAVRNELKTASKQVKNNDGTVEILKMKIQNLEIQSKGRGSFNSMSASQDELDQLKRQNTLLTNSIRQKNSKIDGLLKQIKLLDFQLQQQKDNPSFQSSAPQDSRHRKGTLLEVQSQKPPEQKNDDNRLTKLQQENQKLKKTNEGLVKKLDELSKVLMNQEEVLIQKSRTSFLQTIGQNGQQTSLQQQKKEGCRTQ